MVGTAVSREFLLAAVCCRWPLSDSAAAGIRRAAAGELDWAQFLRLVRRHRIGGLVFNALTKAGVDIPPPVRSALTEHAKQIALQSVALAAETIRLQGAFDEASIPVLILKGAPLAQLAYGTLTIKQGRDIDVLVPPDFALTAFRLLESLDYGLSLPAGQLSEAQRRGVVRHGNEAEFVHGRMPLRVDLHWQLAYNPALLKGIDAHSPAQTVDIPAFGSVRTLETADLFAYLCVHGAYHRWSRLKWLADLNALVAAQDGLDIDVLYHHACAKGAGLCARLALLLARELFDLQLPPDLKAEFRSDPRAGRLVAIALRALTNATSEELNLAGHFLLGEGAAYFLSQLRIVCIGLADVIRFPLPSSLHFFYPILRLPLLIWRRAIDR